ncbi:MAG: EamA family transporter [Deltaproteobacteria bacterium]|nr:MAG: EamA family transporter [Deltaproteobacteria bacterium]
MRSHVIQANLLLTLTAAIWGFSFVAQRVGMDHVGPFTFNGVRFWLGGLSLLPLIWLRGGRYRYTDETSQTGSWMLTYRLPLGGLAAGIVLFSGATFQQVGIQYTTAGKAGFITGLYVVIVPFLGLFFGQRAGMATVAGAILAAIGLYLLSIKGGFTMAFGDLLVLISAFFFAIHMLLIGYLSPQVDPLKLSCLQFLCCGTISLGTAVAIETVTLTGIRMAAIPIVFGGVFSVGVAYTLQTVAQQHAHPAHAAVILSLESAFAALGGWLFLGEILGGRGWVGCGFMLAGMMISQIPESGSGDTG